MDTTRINIDGQVYRKAALTRIEEPPDPTPYSQTGDWFAAFIPEERFGVMDYKAPVREVADYSI